MGSIVISKNIEVYHKKMKLITLDPFPPAAKLALNVKVRWIKNKQKAQR